MLQEELSPNLESIGIIYILGLKTGLWEKNSFNSMKGLIEHLQSLTLDEFKDLRETRWENFENIVKYCKKQEIGVSRFAHDYLTDVWATFRSNGKCPQLLHILLGLPYSEFKYSEFQKKMSGKLGLRIDSLKHYLQILEYFGFVTTYSLGRRRVEGLSIDQKRIPELYPEMSGLKWISVERLTDKKIRKRADDLMDGFYVVRALPSATQKNKYAVDLEQYGKRRGEFPFCAFMRDFPGDRVFKPKNLRELISYVEKYEMFAVRKYTTEMINPIQL